MARRRFASLHARIVWLLLLGLVPSALWAKPAAGSADGTILWKMAGEITLPFEYFNQHIYVTAGINGRPGFAWMLDSGANRDILNLRMARQLGLKVPVKSDRTRVGFGDGQIYVGPEQRVDVEMNSIAVAHAMPVMDLNRFEQHFHHATDGILGYPFFRRYVVKLNFENKQMTVMPPERYRYRGRGVRVPLQASNDFVLMPVEIGSARYAHQTVNVIVDTGSNMTLMLYEPFVRMLKLESSWRHAQPGMGYGLDGEYPLARGSIDSLAIGDAETRDLPVDYLESAEQAATAKDFPGAVGNGILQSFAAVIFDVPHHQIIFELKPARWQSGVERTVTIQ